MCAVINSLEGGKGSLVFSTGMAAISTALLCFLKSGDHIASIYNQTYKDNTIIFVCLFDVKRLFGVLFYEELSQLYNLIKISRSDFDQFFCNAM